MRYCDPKNIHEYVREHPSSSVKDIVLNLFPDLSDCEFGYTRQWVTTQMNRLQRDGKVVKCGVVKSPRGRDAFLWRCP